MKNPVFNINVISENCLQISGDMSGFARKRREFGPTDGSYAFEVTFNKNKRLYKISNDENDGTVRSIAALEERLLRIHQQEKEDSQPMRSCKEYLNLYDGYINFPVYTVSTSTGGSYTVKAPNKTYAKLLAQSELQPGVKVRNAYLTSGTEKTLRKEKKTR